jgi:hypothetical protein
MMRNGIAVDCTPLQHGGSASFTYDGEQFPLAYDGEKLFVNIMKPTQNDMDAGEAGMIPTLIMNSPMDAEYHTSGTNRRLSPGIVPPNRVPIAEWQKRLAMLPPDIITKTLANTTQFYVSVEHENRRHPRRHFKSAYPALRCKRRDEVMATDTFFPSVTTNRGNTCSQFFVGQLSDQWFVHPLKQESHNYQALQDQIRYHGAPKAIRSDYAQSEYRDAEWTSFLRKMCVEQQATVPKSPWMNFAESKIGQLNSMVTNVMREFRVPLTEHDWAQKWCCDVHNAASSRKLNWLSPNTVADGHTCDISKFRFHIWEPIWYYEASKAPQSPWRKGRWLGFADSVGDHLTYFIKTERSSEEGRNVVLIRNIIYTRRKHVGTEREHVNDDIDMADFTLDNRVSHRDGYCDESGETINDELEEDENPSASGELTDDPNHKCEHSPNIDEDNPDHECEHLDNEKDPNHKCEHSPNDEDNPDPKCEHFQNNNYNTDDEQSGDVLEEVLDQVEMENQEDYDFQQIVDHTFENGQLIMTIQYWNVITDEAKTLNIPFGIAKKDLPLECARYIRLYVQDDKRNGYFNNWSKKTIQQLERNIRRLRRIFNVDKTLRVEGTRRRINLARRSAIHKISGIKPTEPKTRAKKKSTVEEQFGIKIPRSTREALLFDRENGNNKWAEAMAKEMAGLERLGVFNYHSPTVEFKKEEGWQFAPLRMIFSIKQQDLRHKARLVIGGHMIDSSHLTTYSSTIKDLSVRLLLIIASKNSLQFMVGDIGNAFCTAPLPPNHKIWSRAGAEFLSKEGAKVSLKRALYGLPVASRAFHEFFGNTLTIMGFTPSRADQDLWIRKSDDYDGYDYIATHVDDILICAKDPSKYMTEIEQEFKVRDVSNTPEYYLGNNLQWRNGMIHISSRKYTREVLRRYQDKFGSIPKQNTPMPTKAHPELDDSPILDLAGHREYQHIVGICQWLIVAGRMDINYAISSLSRFAAAPRHGHLDLARHTLGYLKKIPRPWLRDQPS